MSADEIRRALIHLRKDFLSLRGNAFEHFYCPILHIDEPAELCKAHVIPEIFQASGIWTPQRKDVDCFYGGLVEADSAVGVNARSKHIGEIWIDPDLRRTLRPKLMFEGQELEHYFPATSAKADGHSAITVLAPDGCVLSKVIVKQSPEWMGKLHDKDIQLVVDRNFVPAIVASLLKTAHLSLFRMQGYSYVFSAQGAFLAEILGGAYREYAHKLRQMNHVERQDALAQYFGKWACMACPLIGLDRSKLAGSVIDNQMIACFSSSGRVFALGVIVPVGTDAFCVFVPGDDIETYVGFLKEPPPSVSVRIVRYVRSSVDGDAHWESHSESFRVPMPGF